MIPVIWLLVSVVFLLIHLVPGDPIQQMLGEGGAATDVQGSPPSFTTPLLLFLSNPLI